MSAEAAMDPRNWAMPFHFWSVVYFVFGLIVGSFLNVCIYRMPIGESVISPPSHCPHCRYSIPWFLNIPLATWLYLRGKCANCGAPISIRYFLVELLTGLTFLGCWLRWGGHSPAVAVVSCLFLSALIVGTFIDFELLIIPDEITFGGMVAGVVCSMLVPALHGKPTLAQNLRESLVGMAVGAAVVYAILRAGKLFFGLEKIQLPAPAQVIFTETDIVLPQQAIPFEGLFYRRSDAVMFDASRLELPDRCYRDVAVRLSASQLLIGEDRLDPLAVPYMEVTTERLFLPREAMGLADVKLMGAIGAFLGWEAIPFCIFFSAVVGAAVGVAAIITRHKKLGSQMAYGPYLAISAAVWLLGGNRFWANFLAVLTVH